MRLNLILQKFQFGFGAPQFFFIDIDFQIVDLLGCNVADESGNAVGVLKDVISTGSNDVYVVTGTDGKELLIPALKKHVKEINLDERRITVELPEWVDEK